MKEVKVLELYQQRVVDEKKKLDEKLEALEAFLASGNVSKLDDQNYSLLQKQLGIMRDYSTVLFLRIELF